MGSIYHNQNYFAKTITAPASSVLLSSALPIGSENKSNVEDVIQALNQNSGGSDLEDLSGVNITDPVDGDYLEYDGTANIWINKHDMKIVTWADGSDAEIAAMLDAHYNGKIDIHDYWSVGDERTVHLSAMAATGVGESHVEQDVTMMLMNEGGKTLVTSINGITECAFIVGQKGILVNGTSCEGGYMNSSNTNIGGWDSCARRTWCNNVYKNAFPSTLVDVFKEHQNITANGSSNTTATSNDYFALPSAKEVMGSISYYANSTAESSNSQFKYYETSSNRIKPANVSVISSDDYWYTRSPRQSSTGQFCCITYTGAESFIPASYTYGIAPFGVI